MLARGLLAGRTYTVGVITTDSFGRFSIPVMLGAEDALGAGQISVFMCDTRDEPERERHQIARGVSDILRLIGCRVPEDIALLGFDNWSPMVLGADPPLTSVDMCLEDVGRVAAQHLLLAINKKPTHGVHTVPCRLVTRGSTIPGTS